MVESKRKSETRSSETKMAYPTITEIRFIKIHQKKSLIGFVAFLYDGRMALKDIAVHELREPKAGVRYRLVYPKNLTEKIIFHPTDKTTQEYIDKKISDYLTKTVIPERQVQHEPGIHSGMVRQQSPGRA